MMTWIKMKATKVCASNKSPLSTLVIFCAEITSASEDEKIDLQTRETDTEPGDDEFNLQDESDSEGPLQEADMLAVEEEGKTEEEDTEEDCRQSIGTTNLEADSPIEEVSREALGEASSSAQGADEGLAAAFDEILGHPGPANVKHKAPILLVRPICP